ncbi:MAG: hypothetical protein FD130_671 [Halothiobacillaceae bacterium]|nr:MAG: hypothetical protein FD130_671 [Halothiobacillaceae bacterium]
MTRPLLLQKEVLETLLERLAPGMSAGWAMDGPWSGKRVSSTSSNLAGGSD